MLNLQEKYSHIYKKLFIIQSIWTNIHTENNLQHLINTPEDGFKMDLIFPNHAAVWVNFFACYFPVNSKREHEVIYLVTPVL